MFRQLAPFQSAHPNTIPEFDTFATIMINRIAEKWPMRNYRMINSRILVMVMTISSCATIARADTFAVPSDAEAVMNKYCVACHGEKKQ